jgi:hypothetical protein
MTNWQTHINEIKDILLTLSVRDKNGHITETDYWVLNNYRIIPSGFWKEKKPYYFIGNGGSASIANEASANLAANTGIHKKHFIISLFSLQLPLIRAMMKYSLNP